MTNIQSSVPQLSSFKALAETGEAVSLKNGELKSTSVTPAKLGIFGRIMQWIRGDSPSKVNAETKTKFMAAMSRSYDPQVIRDAVAGNRLDVGNDKPLTSREIKTVVAKADQLSSQRIKLASLMPGRDKARTEAANLNENKNNILNNSPRQKGQGLSIRDNLRVEKIETRLSELEGVVKQYVNAEQEYQEMKGVD